MPELMTVAIADVLSWEPCRFDDGESHLRTMLAPLGERFSALDVLGLEGVEPPDRLWVVLREELVPARVLRLFAVACAERALQRERKAGTALKERTLFRPLPSIFGLEYSLIVFVYEKRDDPATTTGKLNIVHTIFVEAERTADFQMTRSILQILDNEGTAEDLLALMRDRNLPVDDIEAAAIAEDLLRGRPNQGYLTISNALQWRLQYQRVIERAGQVTGVQRVR